MAGPLHIDCGPSVSAVDTARDSGTGWTGHAQVPHGATPAEPLD
jgi:hypothetical protein